MMGLDDESPEVDSAAFSDLDTCEVDDDWLRAADPDQQSAAMRHWLMARYCDPADETPHNSEVGYIYTRGGPWHPRDVLMERFEGIADFDTIEQLVADIFAEIGDELAPTALTAEEDWDVEVETADSPIQDLRKRSGDLMLVLQMEGPEPGKFQARNLVYAALITALETFLWETAVWWLANEAGSVDRLVAARASFSSDRRLKDMVGGEQMEMEGRRQRIHNGMKDMVWHRWRSNWPFLAALLDVEMPSHDTYGFTAAASKRHDIVHRFGQNKDRTEAVYATTAEVEALADAVLAFADDLNARIAARGL
ncbi:hypothetical protein D7T48_00650 [Stenotrophomonas maltophilia]|nr:hypothetical protein [Stenotrophomonas maltophilia]MBA0411284.1 hypothetical protein [Stenotrophomonas maltophilia]MBA0496387.1 hypothetical protein [Stenotrophomonas maltophilia]MBA0500619.1 hypothetical protein [Stenotrophomonas maltophilia]MBA0505821.1 hypothetical protein [Stenotrophomonas maltophilia]